MTPTNKLRFVERSIKLHPFYRSADGGPAFQTYHVLQQWWEQGTTMNMGFGEVPLFDPKGEWRDVPLEKEQ